MSAKIHHTLQGGNADSGNISPLPDCDQLPKTCDGGAGNIWGGVGRSTKDASLDVSYLLRDAMSIHPLMHDVVRTKASSMDITTVSNVLPGVELPYAHNLPMLIVVAELLRTALSNGTLTEAETFDHVCALRKTIPTAWLQAGVLPDDTALLLAKLFCSSVECMDDFAQTSGSTTAAGMLETSGRLLAILPQKDRVVAELSRRVLVQMDKQTRAAHGVQAFRQSIFLLRRHLSPHDVRQFLGSMGLVSMTRALLQLKCDSPSQNSMQGGRHEKRNAYGLNSESLCNGVQYMQDLEHTERRLSSGETKLTETSYTGGVSDSGGGGSRVNSSCGGSSITADIGNSEAGPAGNCHQSRRDQRNVYVIGTDQHDAMTTSTEAQAAANSDEHLAAMLRNVADLVLPTVELPSIRGNDSTTKTGKSYSHPPGHARLSEGHLFDVLDLLTSACSYLWLLGCVRFDAVPSSHLPSAFRTGQADKDLLVEPGAPRDTFFSGHQDYQHLPHSMRLLWPWTGRRTSGTHALTNTRHHAPVEKRGAAENRISGQSMRRHPPKARRTGRLYPPHHPSKSPMSSACQGKGSPHGIPSRLSSEPHDGIHGHGTTPESYNIGRSRTMETHILSSGHVTGPASSLSSVEWLESKVVEDKAYECLAYINKQLGIMNTLLRYVQSAEYNSDISESFVRRSIFLQQGVNLGPCVQATRQSAGIIGGELNGANVQKYAERSTMDDRGTGEAFSHPAISCDAQRPPDSLVYSKPAQLAGSWQPNAMPGLVSEDEECPCHGLLADAHAACNERIRDKVHGISNTLTVQVNDKPVGSKTDGSAAGDEASVRNQRLQEKRESIRQQLTAKRNASREDDTPMTKTEKNAGAELILEIFSNRIHMLITTAKSEDPGSLVHQVSLAADLLVPLSHLCLGQQPQARVCLERLKASVYRLQSTDCRLSLRLERLALLLELLVFSRYHTVLQDSELVD